MPENEPHYDFLEGVNYSVHSAPDGLTVLKGAVKNFINEIKSVL